MVCEKLRVFLDDKPGFIGGLALYLHLRSCPRCRISAAKRRLLGRQISHLEDEPIPPGLRERVHAAALAAAAVARTRSSSVAHVQSRRQGVTTMRRAVMAVVFIGVAVGAAVWRFPSWRGDVALAEVARAMANVTSAHFVAWTLNPETGEKHETEGWVQGTSKLRLIQEGASDFDVADNGEQTVTLRDYNGVLTAWVEAPKRVPGFKSGMPYLDMFVGGEGLTSMLESNGYMVESVTSSTLPDASRAKMITLRHMDGGKAVLVVDPGSNLLTRWETYDKGGRLVSGIESLEYNADIPDSTFDIAIPEETPVIDDLTPASPDVVAAHRAAEANLKAAGWESLSNFDGIGMCGTPYHRSLNFQVLNKNGLALFYRRDRNVYHVVGRALVFALGGAFSQVVEDAEVPAPGPPVLSQRQVLKDEYTKADAMTEEFKRAGGKVILKQDHNGGEEWCGTPYHSKLRFQVLSEGCAVAYMPDRNAYRIFGKVRVFGMGLDKVVEDAEIQAPGPPDGTDEQ